jgi:hypothetical protein
MGDSIKQPQHASEDLNVPEDEAADVRGGGLKDGKGDVEKAPVNGKDS